MVSTPSAPQESADVQKRPSQQADFPEIPLFTKGRIPVLDGLRGLAILLVLLWHGVFQFESHKRVLSALLKFGHLSWSGVDLFFVLSGFLIGGILVDVKGSPSYFRTFYARRAYRILPLYLLIFGFYLAGRYFVDWHATRFADCWRIDVPTLAYATFTQNFWMARNATFGALVMGVTWSLAVEEQFYLAAPVVVRFLTRGQLAYLLGAIVLAAPFLRTVLFSKLNNGDFAAYVIMPCRADALALGVLCALLVRDAPLSKILIARRRLLCVVASISLLVLASFSYKGYDVMSRQLGTFGYSILAIFYSCCLLMALTSKGWLRDVLSRKWLMWLGGMAYCAYLFHLSLMETCARLLGLTWGPKIALGRLVGGALTLVLAWFSWRFFEEPMLQRGHAHKY